MADCGPRLFLYQGLNEWRRWARSGGGPSLLPPYLNRVQRKDTAGVTASLQGIGHDGSALAASMQVHSSIAVMHSLHAEIGRRQPAAARLSRQREAWESCRRAPPALRHW